MRQRQRNRAQLDSTNIDTSMVTGLMAVAAILAVAAGVSGLGWRLIDLGSLVLVLGGTLATTLVNFSFAEMRYASDAVIRVATTPSQSPAERINEIVHFAHRVRKEGLLSLEREVARTPDSFLRLALQLAVDNVPAHEIQRVLETEMRSRWERDRRAIAVFQAMGSIAPALGLIGTLFGLIQMLGSLQNPGAIGPAMSLALVTTLYGALLANVVCLPLAGKLKNRCEEEQQMKAITIEGITSLSKQESAILLEQRLQSFLPRAGNAG